MSKRGFRNPRRACAWLFSIGLFSRGIPWKFDLFVGLGFPLKCHDLVITDPFAEKVIRGCVTTFPGQHVGEEVVERCRRASKWEIQLTQGMWLRVHGSFSTYWKFLVLPPAETTTTTGVLLKKTFVRGSRSSSSNKRSSISDGN